MLLFSLRQWNYLAGALSPNSQLGSRLISLLCNSRLLSLSDKASDWSETKTFSLNPSRFLLFPFPTFLPFLGKNLIRLLLACTHHKQCSLSPPPGDSERQSCIRWYHHAFARGNRTRPHDQREAAPLTFPLANPADPVLLLQGGPGEHSLNAVHPPPRLREFVPSSYFHRPLC